MQTAERSSGGDPSENVIYNRCLFAYTASANYIKGDVLELGSGEGYGVELLSPLSEHYLALDKFVSHIENKKNVEFRQAMFPSLSGVPDNTFDVAITFQVIEHIRDDKKFVSEIYRVLKPGGKLLLSTPNRIMSLSRNPWHVREYTGQELYHIINNFFTNIELKGVYGNDTVNNYHEKNRISVNKIMRFDFLKLQYRLPAWILKIPYDIMNRLNRRKLLKTHTSTIRQVTTDDFYIDTYTDTAYDIFIIAEK